MAKHNVFIRFKHLNNRKNILIESSDYFAINKMPLDRAHTDMAECQVAFDPTVKG